MPLAPLLKKGELPVVASENLPSGGPTVKTAYCFSSCPRAYTASGFVPDYVPKNPRIAVVQALPASDDAISSIPFSGGYGRMFWAVFGRAFGLRKEDVLVSTLLRCHSKGYPTGADAPRAERACRHWDYYAHAGRGLAATGLRSLATWNPNWYTVTFGLDKVAEIDAFMALAIEDFRKAMRFQAAGFRPCVLLGTEVLRVVAPWLSGGAKDWRGHWWEGSWPFKDPETEEKLRAFPVAAPKYKRQPSRAQAKARPPVTTVQEKLF